MTRLCFIWKFERCWVSFFFFILGGYNSVGGGGVVGVERFFVGRFCLVGTKVFSVTELVKAEHRNIRPG